MKIAILGTAYPYKGGLAAYNERLAKELYEQGHEVTIYTFTLQYPKFIYPGKSQYSNEKRKDSHPEIIRCINAVNPLNWLFVGFKIKKEKPDLVIVKFWIPLLSPCLGTILKLVRRNKHSKIITIIDNIIPHEKRFGDKPFAQYFLNQVHGLIAMSDSVLNDINLFNKTKPKLFSPHPVYDHFGNAESKNKALQKLKLPQDYKYMLFFGLIRDYKGLDLLIEAFADTRFRNLKLKLIVAGEFYSNEAFYKNLIQKNNLENEIILVNKFIPDSEVANYFNATDLVVQPYKTATQSGVTQIAYHFNKPMVVTNVGGLPEMCPHGKVGYISKPNPTDIAHAIFKFFHQENHQFMIDNILEEKKKYSWKILTDNIYNLAEKIEAC